MGHYQAVGWWRRRVTSALLTGRWAIVVHLARCLACAAYLPLPAAFTHTRFGSARYAPTLYCTLFLWVAAYFNSTCNHTAPCLLRSSALFCARACRVLAAIPEPVTPRRATRIYARCLLYAFMQQRCAAHYYRTWQPHACWLLRSRFVGTRVHLAIARLPFSIPPYTVHARARAATRARARAAFAAAARARLLPCRARPPWFTLPPPLRTLPPFLPARTRTRTLHATRAAPRTTFHALPAAAARCTACAHARAHACTRMCTHTRARILPPPPACRHTAILDPSSGALLPAAALRLPLPHCAHHACARFTQHYTRTAAHCRFPVPHAHAHAPPRAHAPALARATHTARVLPACPAGPHISHAHTHTQRQTRAAYAAPRTARRATARILRAPDATTLPAGSHSFTANHYGPSYASGSGLLHSPAACHGFQAWLPRLPARRMRTLVWRAWHAVRSLCRLRSFRILPLHAPRVRAFLPAVRATRHMPVPPVAACAALPVRMRRTRALFPHTTATRRHTTAASCRTLTRMPFCCTAPLPAAHCFAVFAGAHRSLLLYYSRLTRHYACHSCRCIFIRAAMPRAYCRACAHNTRRCRCRATAAAYARRARLFTLRAFLRARRAALYTLPRARTTHLPLPRTALRFLRRLPYYLHAPLATTLAYRRAFVAAARRRAAYTLVLRAPACTRLFCYAVRATRCRMPATTIHRHLHATAHCHILETRGGIARAWWRRQTPPARLPTSLLPDCLRSRAARDM